MTEMMNKTCKLATRGSVVHILAWNSAFFAVSFLFSHSAAHQAYGEVAGWWCALYVGYVADVRLLSIIPCVFLYVVYAIAAIIINPDRFYHDLPVPLDWFVVFVVIGRALYFVSPIFVNLGVRRCAAFLSARSPDPSTE